MAFRIGFAIFVGIGGWLAFIHRGKRESKDLRDTIGSRKTSLFDPYLFPLVFGLFLVVLIGSLFRGNSYLSWSAFLIPIMLTIAVFYAILLIALPLLRQVFSARAIATLWLLPTILYISLNTAPVLSPIIYLPFPLDYLKIILWVWLAGFAFSMAWQLWSHYQYRKRILESSVPLFDYYIHKQWVEEQRKHGIKTNIPTLISPEVYSPVTIGCFESTMRLVFPERSYRQEEIDLILRHEARHIQRADVGTKFFIGFIAALSWFNPLAWIARKRVSEDLELSNDESVLEGASEETRQLYANLILNSADCSKGFSTCLSASATSLRYRLKNIVKPAKKFTGGILVGLMVSLLFLTFGVVALADSNPVPAIEMTEQWLSDMPINSISIKAIDAKETNSQEIYGWKEEALKEYLNSVSIRQIESGFASIYDQWSRDSRSIHVEFGDATEGDTRVGYALSDKFLWISVYRLDGPQNIYLVAEPIDWKYIQSLLDYNAVDPNPTPEPPELGLYFNEKVNSDGELMMAEKSIWIKIVGGEPKNPTTEPVPESIGGVHGSNVETVKLEFDTPPNLPYEIEIFEWGQSAKSVIVHSDEIINGTLKLMPYSAHYIVKANFDIGNTHYNMRYYFDVELPDESN